MGQHVLAQGGCWVQGGCWLQGGCWVRGWLQGARWVLGAGVVGEWVLARLDACMSAPAAEAGQCSSRRGPSSLPQVHWTGGACMAFVWLLLQVLIHYLCHAVLQAWRVCVPLRHRALSSLCGLRSALCAKSLFFIDFVCRPGAFTSEASSAGWPTCCSRCLTCWWRKRWCPRLCRWVAVAAVAFTCNRWCVLLGAWLAGGVCSGSCFETGKQRLLLHCCCCALDVLSCALCCCSTDMACA